MSRSGYSDDGENYACWRGAVRSAISGKRGQAFLREMVRALDAMPDKRLIRDELVTATGEVCALGSVAKARGTDTNGVDPEDAGEVGELFGIARAMAAEIAYQNDERWKGRPEYVGGAWKKKPDPTPEERWTLMREWAVSKIRVTEEELEST